MTSPSPAAVIPLAPLPERSRLLHIGMMKSGTTSIQRAASARRKQLLTHGVRYPGRLYNHRQAALALMRRDADGDPDTRAAGDAWDVLKAEIEADRTRRVLVSNEFIAGWSADIARRFLDELGERTHVVITMRSYPAILPSVWQQYVKTGYAIDLETFLQDALVPEPDPLVVPPGFAQHNQAGTVRRWADVAGPERLTVVVGAASEPFRIPEAFETMLGLPSGMLDAASQGGFHRNRSLTAEEAALLLRVNQVLQAENRGEVDRIRSLRNRVAAGILDRDPAVSDTALTLPVWASARAAEIGRESADQILASGVGVVGDLDELSRVPQRSGRSTMPVEVPTELAANVVAAALALTLGRDDNPAATRAIERLRSTTRRALRSVRRRLRHH